MAEIYNTNLSNLAIAYISFLKVRVTVSTMRQQLNENPYFPSLYSLSNTFERFHIPLKVEKEKSNNLQPPLIAYSLN